MTTASSIVPPGTGGIVPPRQMCQGHPSVAAHTFCQSCRAPVCSTCLFVLAGDLQLCPACASNFKPRVSSKRQTLGWVSAALALLSMIGFGAMIAMNGPVRDRAHAESIGIAFIVVFVVCLIALLMGLCTLERRLKTPAAAWVGIAIGSLVVAIGMFGVIRQMLQGFMQ